MFAKRTYLWFLLMVLCLGCESCMSHAQREAQTVVAQADNLWQAGQMYGIDAGDSATLAHAYETLNSFVHRTSSLGTFSHSCYHYGKLLRAKDNPVEAMRVFIDATHSGTKDYHILGRIYNNIGDICHLAGEFQLSYDMFEKSADMFLRNSDTLSYYYALNDMAFELAEQGKKEEVYRILRKIETCNNNLTILSLSLATKALACNRVQQYDSAIYYTSQLLVYGYNEPDVLLTRAQAYSYMGLKDSAVYYANLVLNNSKKLFHRCNALYILTNEDEDKNIASVREMAMDRADTQRLIEIRQGKLSQAAQLLEQDLNRKPDWTWLYSIIVTLVVICIGIGVYVYRKQKKCELLYQKEEDLKQSNSALQKKQDKLQSNYQTNLQRMEEDIKHQCLLLRENENLSKDLAWGDFEAMTKIADNHFYKLVSKLRSMKVLNETEIRLCILVLIDMNRSEISEKLPYSLSGVGKLKDHTAKSLGTTGKNLRQYLINLALEG